MKVFVHNEYYILKHCFMAYPCNFQASEQQIDKTIAINQYNNLVNLLLEHKVQIFFLDLNHSAEQVFARDIGFVIEDILFISNMAAPERQSETQGLIALAQKHKIKYHVMANQAEGGDIMVHDDKVIMGQGERTKKEAVEEIECILTLYNKHYEMITVNFDISKIHLDCVFNIVDNDTCFLSSGVYGPQSLTKHFAKVIEIPDEDLPSLAPNVVTLGNHTVLCSSKNFSDIVQKNGYNSIFIDFSEIIKANGSLGCCILPILRVP